MSLDKWIKPPKKKEKTKKKPELKKNEITKKNSKPKASINETETIIAPKKPVKKFIKYILICPKKNCKYQKTLMKKKLTEKDKICPRCKSKMNVKIKK